MEYLVLGFLTGLSLILAIGAQNIFVIEQGLKKQYVFLVCIICSLSDLLLIFFGILLFHFFHQYFNLFVELTLNILLIIFLIYFIYSKIKSLEKFPKKKTVSEYTCAFRYVKPSVLSDTSIFDVSFASLLKLIFLFIDLIFEKMK